MSLNVDHISGGWQLFISGSTIKSMLSNNANSKTFYFYYFPFLLCVCVCVSPFIVGGRRIFNFIFTV